MCYEILNYNGDVVCKRTLERVDRNFRNHFYI